MAVAKTSSITKTRSTSAPSSRSTGSTYTDNKGVERYTGSNNRVDGTTGYMSATDANAAATGRGGAVNTMTSSGNRNAAVDSTAANKTSYSASDVNTYGNRETAYTFKDASGKVQTVYSNLTRYDDALKDAQSKGQLGNGEWTLANATTYGVSGSGGSNAQGTTYGSSGYSGNAPASGGWYGEAMRGLTNAANTYGGLEGYQNTAAGQGLKNTLSANDALYKAYMQENYFPAIAQAANGGVNWNDIASGQASKEFNKAQDAYLASQGVNKLGGQTYGQGIQNGTMAQASYAQGAPLTVDNSSALNAGLELNNLTISKANEAQALPASAKNAYITRESTLAGDVQRAAATGQRFGTTESDALRNQIATENASGASYQVAQTTNAALQAIDSDLASYVSLYNSLSSEGDRAAVKQQIDYLQAMREAIA